MSLQHAHDDGRVCYKVTSRYGDGWWYESSGDPRLAWCERDHKVAEKLPTDRGDFGMPGLGIGDMITHPPDTKPEFTPGRMFDAEELGSIFLPKFPRTELAKRIVKFHAPKVFEHFITRNNEYGDDNDFNLGAAGQYVDISRKVQKLKRRLWEHQPERDGEESTRTIVTELIGHLFMTLDYLDQEQEHAEEGNEEGPC